MAGAWTYVVTRMKASKAPRMVASVTWSSSQDPSATPRSGPRSSDPRPARSRAPCIFADQPSSPVVSSDVTVAGSACARPSSSAIPFAGGRVPVHRTPSPESTRAAAPPR